MRKEVKRLSRGSFRTPDPGDFEPSQDSFERHLKG